MDNLKTKAQEKLAALTHDQQILAEALFGSVDAMYETIYLIAKNEHLTESDKPARYEERLATIRAVRTQVEQMLTAWGLDGKELVADIAGDYFDDYVAYRERPATLTNEQFVAIINKIVRAR